MWNEHLSDVCLNACKVFYSYQFITRPEIINKLDWKLHKQQRMLFSIILSCQMWSISATNIKLELIDNAFIFLYKSQIKPYLTSYLNMRF